MGMKRALVLSGGGSKGAFEVGALEYLLIEEKLDFQIFIGTSVGALNAAFLGQACNREELVDLAQELKALWLGLKGNNSIYESGFLGRVLRFLFRDSLYNPSGLRDLIKIKIDLERLFHPATVVKVTAVALESGDLFCADSRNRKLREDFLSYILASASMPLFFPAVPIAGKHWYDGGLRDVTPLAAAVQEKPDEIVVITTFPLSPGLQAIMPSVKPGGAVKAILRTIEILVSEIAVNDLQLAQALNKSWWKFPDKHPIPIRIIAPKNNLAGDALDFSPLGIRENMRSGYEAARHPRLLAVNTSVPKSALQY
ncbi:MAG TPA: hypothetical protein DDW93_04705 [Firmicutes bacterium]|jgi:NTE family protein|nr:hypothetical protein [Bacillota bacterium]HBK69413.1 hypothetical protein [Bacillota bacterium]